MRPIGDCCELGTVSLESEIIFRALLLSIQKIVNLNAAYKLLIVIFINLEKQSNQ